MLPLWLSIALLLLLALAFMAWPLWRYRHASVSTPSLAQGELEDRLVENVRLFREHLAELENSLASQAIDQQQFNQLKVELERNLLDDEASLRASQGKTSSFLGLKVVAAFSVLLLLAGILLYQKYGSADDLLLQDLQQEKILLDNQDIQAGRNPDPIRAQNLIAEYKQRLASKPDSLQYWFLLARAHMELGEFAQAVPAYQQILQLEPQSPMIIAELAQAMFLRDGNNITPPVVDLAKRALALDPKNIMALGLLGIDAFGRKAYKDAIHYWQTTVDLLGVDSPTAQTLVAGIERAELQLLQEGGSPDQAAAKPVSLQVSVSLGDKVKAAPEQTVFIYARAWKGTPMPLAIARVKVSDLPTQITLDESMAMSPAASLATATEIEVVARISSDGSAQTKAGDWQAQQGPISVKAIPEKLELQINSQVGAQ
ncbi:MAG TPA: c-type cytochrome biogenesis protein CcmI [Cellvibrio sp.]|nr:c-type cytochrome biogenesis protein CcmI [Cellvibrio sp.]